MRLSLPVPPILLFALLTAGCATVSTSALVPEALAFERAVGGSVTIRASGSPKRGYVVRPLVSSEAIRDALTTAVLESELFDEIVPAGADRSLLVTVERIEEPEIGLDQTCTVTVHWQLTTGDGARTLWEKRITTTRTIDFLDEIDSEARGQVAIEGALRSNLREGLEQLSRKG
ncbi:MAG: hypothetical protein VX460_09030 [Planctomycetota bacterium]|nr:hypothetical protein [Planctomycetota bacterium]